MFVPCVYVCVCVRVCVCVTHVHFPAAAGQVEQQRDLELSEGFKVFAETFSGELLQGVLVPLGCLLHFPLLHTHTHTHTRYKRLVSTEYRRTSTHYTKERTPHCAGPLQSVEVSNSTNAEFSLCDI